MIKTLIMSANLTEQQYQQIQRDSFANNFIKVYQNKLILEIMLTNLPNNFRQLLKIKKHLSLQPLIDSFKDKFSDIDKSDRRRQRSVDYRKLDTSLAGLACMFYKSSDMFSFQERNIGQY